MDTPIPVDLGRIAQDLQIRRVQVESVRLEPPELIHLVNVAVVECVREEIV